MGSLTEYSVNPHGLASKGEVIGEADDWNASLANLFGVIGAFALPEGSRDAALVVRLSPGVYSALLRNASDDAGGDPLVEVYFLE